MNTRQDSDNYKLYQRLNKNKAKLLDVSFSEVLRLKHFDKMSAKVFSNMLSRVFIWFEDWLAIEAFKNQEYAKKIILNKTYNQRGLFKHADKVAVNLKRDIATKKEFSRNESKALTQLSFNQYFSNNPKKKEKDDLLFEECINRFMSSSIEDALVYLIEIENKIRLNIERVYYQKKVLESLVASIPQTPLSKILSLCKESINGKDKGKVIKLKRHLKSNQLDKSSDLFLVLTFYLRKSAVSLWRDKKEGVQILILEAYQLNFLALENNSNQKILPVNLFNSVSALAIFLDFEETEKFINKWMGKVHTNHRSSVLKYCNALNAFRHNRFDVMPPLLTSLEFDDPVYKLISNALMIITQYELKNEDLMIGMIQNFKKQLKRNPSIIDTSVQLMLFNLMDIIIILNKSKYDKKVVLNLSDYSPYFFKSWVLKQM